MRLICALIVVLQVTTWSRADTEDDENPFMDLASSFLQNAMQNGGQAGGGGVGLAALGGIVGSFMQSDQGRQIGDMLTQGGGGGNGAGDLLSGLSSIGSLLSNKNGKMDPSMISSMVSMFAQQMGGAGSQQEQAPAQKRSRRQSEDTGDFDIGSLLNMASGLFDNQNGGNGMMPIIMSTLSSFTGPQAEKRAHQHEDHAWFLPPALEQIHVYLDHFANSELGHTIWVKSGLKQSMKSFMGPEGKVDFDKVLKSLENHSFRRRWIKSAVAYLTEWVVHIAKPEVQERYLNSAQYLLNSFLQSQGFPASATFSAARPAESLGAVANHAVRRYFQADSDVAVYVIPAVDYVKSLVKMAQVKGNSILGRADHDALSDRLTDALNLEVIEPVLRVHRAYRHSLKAPHCRQHLMCLVNRHNGKQSHGLPGFKAGLTKLSSLVASAALSYQSGDGFWDLYNAIQNDVNCKERYPADCSEFHEHEEKVTTEYYHNEL